MDDDLLFLLLDEGSSSDSPTVRAHKERTPTFWEEKVPAYDDHEFIDDFRLSRELFEWLCQELAPELQKDSIGRGNPISVPKRVAITLWRLASGCSMRLLARQFEIGLSTAFTVFYEVVIAITKKLYTKTIRYPPKEDEAGWKEIATDFHCRRGLWPCVGAIDGTHIPLRKPAGDTINQGYINRKGWASLNFQCVVDAHGIFRNRFMRRFLLVTLDQCMIAVFSASVLYSPKPTEESLCQITHLLQEIRAILCFPG
ncbi:hypothetical protein BKA69DRAFT_548456 [Paraphysoderma sedebokerense]|nr:hypothetical protein BKA69DRAFT_548456 [Paraphysoderma sedebokerense]